jgi:hypothetical protein
MLRVFGTRNGLVLDQDQETLIKLRGNRLKSYAEKFVPPWMTAKQYVDNSVRNVRLFLARDFQMKAGMKCLIEAFYQSVRTGAPPPIPYREILLTSQIMEEIFNQLDAASEPGPRPKTAVLSEV